MNAARHGGRGWCAAFLTLILVAFPTTPASAQSAANVDVSPELLGVLVETLAPPEGQAADGDRPLVASLTVDPVVTTVLQRLGVTDLAPREYWPPTPWELERLQVALAGGAPAWLADAIQISVEHELAVVTPLQVLMVLLRDPDDSTTAFLDAHGLNGPATAALVDEAFHEMVLGVQ